MIYSFAFFFCVKSTFFFLNYTLLENWAMSLIVIISWNTANENHWVTSSHCKTFNSSSNSLFRWFHVAYFERNKLFSVFTKKNFTDYLFFFFEIVSTLLRTDQVVTWTAEHAWIFAHCSKFLEKVEFCWKKTSWFQLSLKKIREFYTNTPI